MSKLNWMKILLPLLLVIVLVGGTFLFLYPTHVEADSIDLYWYGGSGAWNSGTAHWSANSGNVPAAAHVTPTATNKVIFDANSGVGTLTISSAAVCASMDWTSSSLLTLTMGTQTLNIGGYLKMIAGVTETGTGAITFSSTTGPNNITMAGKFAGHPVTFNGAGGSWALQDAFNISSNILTLTNGTLNTNGQTVTTGNFVMTSGTKVLTLGATVWNSSGNWTATSTTTGLNADTSSLRFTSAATQFTGGALSYNDVRLNGSGAAAILDANTFATLQRVGTAISTDTLVVSAAQTISTTLTLTGNSAANRLAIRSNTTTPRIISSASNVVTNSDFYYITGAGAGSWDFSGNADGCADMGGNSNITFSPSYWIAGTGNWVSGAATHWSGASGGTPHADFLPTPTTDTVFDANSFSAGSQSVTIDSSATCRDMTWTNATNTPTFTGSAAFSIYGSLIGITAMIHSYSGTMTWAATSGTKNITTGGSLVWDNPMTFNGVEGIWQNQDTFNNGASTITLTNGTWDTNGKTISTGTFTTASGTNTLTLGASDFNVSVAWTATNLGTINANTSTIYFTGSGTFAGAGKTYNNLNMIATGTPIISGSNVFANLTRLGTATTGDSLKLTYTTTQTISGTFTATGNSAINYLRLTSTSSSSLAEAIINAAVVAVDYCGLAAITGLGAGDWDLWGHHVTNVSTLAAGRGSPEGIGGNITLWAPVAYWVGGTGSWTGTTPSHWAASTGGAADDANYPGYNTDVFFDSNSFSVGSALLQMGSAVGENYYFCDDMDWSGARADVEWAAGSGLYNDSNIYIYGNLDFGSGVAITTTGLTELFLESTTNKNITWAGSTADGISMFVNGDHTLIDDIAYTGNMTFNNYSTAYPATLTATNRYITVTGIFAIGSLNAVKTIALGTGTITCGVWTANGFAIYTSITGNHTIVMTGAAANFDGAGISYYDVLLSGANQTIEGSNTFHNLTRIGTAIKTESWVLLADQSVSGALTITGNSDVNRILVSSDVLGTARSIDVLTSVSVEHAEFADFAASGPLIPWNLAAFDAGPIDNVSQITFPAPNYHFWVNNSGSWSDITHWATGTGGVGGSSILIPLCQDVAKFDVNSFSIASCTITLNMPRYGNITTTNSAHLPSFTSATNANVYGTLTLGGITWTTSTGTFMYNRHDVFLTSGASPIVGDLTISSLGYTVTLGDALHISGTLTLLKGTLDTAGYAVTASTLISTVTTDIRGLTLHDSLVTLNGTAAGNKWAVATTNFTFADNTSTIYMTNSTTNAQIFVGGGYQNYNHITIAGLGNYTTTITGSNKCINLVVDRSQDAKTIAFTSGTTTTVSALGIATIGTTRVTLTNTSSNSIWTLRCTSGVVYADYIDVRYCVTTGGAGFYSGTHSTIFNGVIANGTGSLLGGTSPFSLYEGVTNTPTVSVAGNFAVTLGSAGLTGTATTGGWVVTGSPKALTTGLTTITVAGGGSGTIDIIVTGSGWNPSSPIPPIVVTNAATNLGSSTFTGNATVTSMGAYTLGFAVFFQTSLTGLYAGEEVNSPEQPVIIIGAVSQLILGLSIDTNYHYRAVIRYNAVELVYGADEIFTTTGRPDVATGSAVSVTFSGAVLQGSIVSVGVYPPNYVYFEYTTDPLYLTGITATPEQMFSIVTGFSATITGLTAGTTYHYRAVCRYVNGISIYVGGLDATFVTTTALLPTVLTLSAINATYMGATLQGSVDSLGNYTTVYGSFEYGTTVAFGSQTTEETITGAQAVNATVNGLVPSTPYYFRFRVRYTALDYVNGSTILFNTVEAPGTSQDRGQDVLPDTDTTDWFLEPDISGSLVLNPFRGLVLMVSDSTSLNEIQVWRLYALIMIIFITVLVGRALPNHLFLAGAAAGVSIGAAVAMTIFPMWALVFVAGCIIGGLVAERTGQI